MFKLIIQDDEGKTTVVPLIRDEITIGRKEGNTIRLTERNVSRRHARIVKNSGSVLVEDLDSYNGVKVNGARIQGRIPVNESDRIQIGDYLLELKLERGQVADPYGDQRTQPMERVEIPAAAMGPAAQMPAPANGTNGHGNGHAQHAQTTHNTAVVNIANLPANVRKVVQGGAAEPAPMPPQAPMAQVRPETPGRLVIVSSNFPGREFLLDKPAMVIGRTDDNDVVVNHRSISRHHAKIVREHGRYAIVDLQSANGVRVNGEEYGKVELRKGDLIDLGHVRLRFVEPGEDFIFDRDAAIVDPAIPPKKGKGALFAIIGLLLVGGVAAIVVVAMGGSKDKKPGASDPAIVAGTKPETTPPTNAKPAADPGGQKPEPALVAPTGAAQQSIADARAAVEKEEWSDALTAAKLALKTEPGNEEAQRLVEQAESEMVNKKLYEDFVRLSGGKKVSEAARKYQEIPEGSAYRAKAQQKFDELRDAFVRPRIAEMQQLAGKGSCDKLGGKGRAITEVFPDAADDVGRVADSCKTVAAVEPKDPRKDPEKEPRKDPEVRKDPEKEPEKEPPPGKSYEEAMTEAKAAFQSGQFGNSLRAAEEALRAKGKDQGALSIAAISACNLKNRDKALKYLNQLQGERRNMAKQSCLRQGITPE